MLKMRQAALESGLARLLAAAGHRCAILGFALLAACQPEAPQPAASPLATAAPPAAASPASGGSIRPEVIAIAGEAYAVHSFEFRLASARFEVIDMDMSSVLTPVLERGGAALVVNGGFFDRQRRAEGLVVSGGQELAPFSATLGGGVLVVAKGRASLHDAIGFALPPGAEFVVQARPRLVVDGARNVQGDDGPRAERTALCVRDGGQRMEVIVVRGEAPGRGPTLGQLAAQLVARGCEQALNLDGGPSTGVAWREHGRTQEMVPRGPIRHAFAVQIEP
jgi:uncharacterized protein YigE (DUF2233 family)